jgi:hypothetical protein
MALDLDISGGDSVYCINESQLREATRLAQTDPDSGRRIQTMIDELERSLSRNERAALAFLLIDRLLKTPARS